MRRLMDRAEKTFLCYQRDVCAGGNSIIFWFDRENNLIRKARRRLWPRECIDGNHYDYCNLCYFVKRSGSKKM